MLSHIPILLTRALSVLPLPALRGLGWLLGALLYGLVGSRRRVVDTNLRLCFPAWSKQERRRHTFACFVYFAQAWLDRGWLWQGRPETVLGRLRISGAVGELNGTAPTVIFAPHFVGLDAGWTALTQQLARGFTTIYTRQANPVSDAWIRQGRQRFGPCHLVAQLDGARPVIARLKAGEPLYLLPDMNFDPKDSLFVPFFGNTAATVPSLSRFARLARDFWHHHPPLQGDLAQWGGDLPAFLHSNAQLTAEPYLSDVARVEWALHRCALAADHPADTGSLVLLTTVDPAVLTLRLASGLAVVKPPSTAMTLQMRRAAPSLSKNAMTSATCSAD